MPNINRSLYVTPQIIQTNMTLKIWTTIIAQECYLKYIKSFLLAPKQLIIFGPKEKKNTPCSFGQGSSQC